LKGHVVQKDCSTLEDGTEYLSRNVGTEVALYAG